VPVIGVDVGGTKLAAAVVDPPTTVLAVRQVPTPASQRALIETLSATVKALARSAPRGVSAVGVGVPSLIDRRTGRAEFTVNAELADVDLEAVLVDRLGLPVAVDNDANLALLAEARAGAAQHYATTVMLTIGTGIGGGVMIDRAIFRGGRGTGAEPGHVTVQADGPPCQGNCPNRGCLETMASGTAISREARVRAAAEPDGALAAAVRAGQPLDPPTIAALARAGDRGAMAVLRDAGRWLGVGLAGLGNLFNPDAFVIGGGVAELGELILEPARAEYRRRALPPNAHADVRAAAFGANAGVLGAALAARDALAAPGRAA
jgi:glucokinase